MPDLSKLVDLVTFGENEKAVAEADRLISAAVPVKVIINDGLIKALQALKNKCTIENFQILEVLLSCRAMSEVIDQIIARDLENKMDKIVDFYDQKQGSKENQVVLVIGSIEGDVHDLGKHLVVTLSNLSGLRVIDLGKDVAPEVFVATAKKEKADIIGVSALMTVCLPSVNEIKTLALQEGINPLVVVGGAAAQQAEANYLNVDYIAFDAFDALDYFLQQKKGNS